MKDHLDKVTFLTQEDLNFMYDQAFLFQEWKRGLYNMIEISNGLTTPFYDDNHYHVSMELKKEVRYTKRKLLRELKEQTDSTARSFVRAIEWYLEKKYKMDISLECTDEMLNISDWKEQDYIKEILEQLRGQFGNTNVDSIQLQQLSDKILVKEPVANGRVLEFPSKHHHAWRLLGNTIYTEFICWVLSAVSYQDRKTFELPGEVKRMMDYCYEDAPIPALPSMEKYKVFKNGKLTFTFSSSESLNEFMTLLKDNQTIQE